MIRWSRAALALLATSIAFGGCAQERDPINRVQPNAFDKHFFVGPDLAAPADDPEFYWRNYVVDASASQSLVGVGSWGHVDRVRWEITENLLLARKAYQIVDGQDDKGLAKSFARAPNGTIVAAYKITSHFDIRRQYNTTTGEELNVVEENSTDRPWNQREHMRVDWSVNQVDNPMWEDVFTGSVLGNLAITPVAYYVNDPNSDDAPHIDAAEGYLDITNKFLVAPATTASPFLDLPGKAPTCLLYGIYTGNATYECDAQEATVRASYWRIDPKHSFEPLENTKATLDVVGNPGGIGNSWSVGVVSAGRQGWDPQYGYTDALYHRFAYIHNLWKNSHQSAECDANFDGDKNGTADQCENADTGYSGNEGSQCDVFSKRCTIPYRDRAIKTIGYWINKEAPSDLLDPVDDSGNPAGRGALEDLVYSWNQLVSVAIGYAREVECRKTGGSRDDCHGEFFTSTSDPATKQMVSYGGWLLDVPSEEKRAITFCHNPVRAYDDHDVCGKTGEKARVGDIRKNFVFYWPYESRAPWGGIANWNADPLTGEILGAAAQIMGRSATFAAAQQRDIIQIAMGDLSINDVVTGVPAQRYSKMLENGFAPQALTKAEIDRRVAQVNLTHLKQTTGARPAPQTDVLGPVKAEMKLFATTTADPSMLSTSLLELGALAKKLRGTTYEAELVDAHWLVDAFGANPKTSIDDSVLDAVSPLRGLDPGRLQAFRQVVTEGLRSRGVCFMDTEAPVIGSIYLPSLSGWFKAKYGGMDKVERGRAIYSDLWKEAVKGIGLHEIGHSLGMLHQFASSWDSLNFNPQYWQLRTNEGKALARCNGPRTGDDDTCLGPRYVDPPTKDEQGTAGEPRPSIDYFGNTSTMEYQIERGGETVGLGTFDLHTMKALYGRVLETFDDRVIGLREQGTFKYKLWTQLTEREILNGSSLYYAHYTETARQAKVFDTKRDCRAATDEEKATAGWRVVHGKVCAPQPKDHWKWDEFMSDSLDKTDPDFKAPYWHAKDADGKDRVRWHYRWGVGHNSYFHDNDSDAGADAYEVTVNTAKRFDATYPWTYFRRQNKEYYYRRIASQVSDRFFDRMRSYHWLVATDLSRARSPSQLESDDDLRPYVMAQAEMFNMLARAVLMPEPGDYFSPVVSGDVQSRQPIDTTKWIYDTPGAGQTGTPDFSIGIIDGRYIGEEFDNEIGGSWDYLHWIKHSGFTVEKARAIEALVDGRPTLFTIARDNYLDGRNVKINFRNDIPDAVDRLIGGILAEDWETIGMHVGANDKTPSPEMIDLISASPVRPQGARVLFPNLGYKQQLSTALFAALFSRLNADMTLVNKMRLWIDGQVGGVNVPDAQQIRFSDPATGYTYIARKYGSDVIDAKTVERGVASRMIAHANAMLAATYLVVRNIDDKPVLDSYGRPQLILDGNGEPQLEASGGIVLPQLRRYVGLLDSVREIGYRLGYGPLGGPDGGD